MKLTKQQRLDWYTYMYFVWLSEPSSAFTYLWNIEEEGSLSGFPITTYIGITMLPELWQRQFNLPNLEKAIAECEKSKK